MPNHIDLDYRSYISTLRARLTPSGISKAPLEKSQRFPGPYQGATIITPPWDPAHVPVYQFLADSQRLVANGNEGLTPTPGSSFHLTSLGITSGELHARLAESGGLHEVIAETNRILRAYQPKSFTPNFRLAGFFPMKDCVVAGLAPLDEPSFLALLDLRETILGNPVLAAAGVAGDKQVLFHITTHYRVGDEFDRPVLDANLTGLNQVVAKRAPLIFPVSQLIFTRYYSLNHFSRMSGSPIIKFL